MLSSQFNFFVDILQAAGLANGESLSDYRFHVPRFCAPIKSRRPRSHRVEVMRLARTFNALSRSFHFVGRIFRMSWCARVPRRGESRYGLPDTITNALGYAWVSSHLDSRTTAMMMGPGAWYISTTVTTVQPLALVTRPSADLLSLRAQTVCSGINSSVRSIRQRGRLLIFPV